MTIPTLKRVKITSIQELRTWLAKNADHAGSVMVVTQSAPDSENYVSVDAVGGALGDHGWQAGRRYTLNKTLLGHVITKAARA